MNWELELFLELIGREVHHDGDRLSGAKTNTLSVLSWTTLVEEVVSNGNFLSVVVFKPYEIPSCRSMRSLH